MYRIEDVLESVQEGAPPPRTGTAEIIANARRIRQRRRWATVAGAGAAAVATVALVAGVTGTVPRAGNPVTPAAAEPTPAKTAPKVFTQPKGLGYTVGTSRAGAWQVGPVRAATYGYQEIPIYRDGETVMSDGVPYPVSDGTITLYRPGAYDPASFGRSEVPEWRYGAPEDVTIAGRPGIMRELQYDLPDLADLKAQRKKNSKLKPNDPSIKRNPYSAPAVAWQYDGTAWATFLPSPQRETLSREETVAVVEGLEPQAGQPIRAPYTFGWLPAGWRVTGAEQSAPDVDPFVSEVTIDERLPTGKDLVTPIDYYPGGGHLTIFKGKPKPGNAPAKGRDLSCKDNNGYCTMVIDDEYSAELQRVGKALTMDDVRHILRELKVIPSLNDLNTWKPLS